MKRLHLQRVCIASRNAPMNMKRLSRRGLLIGGALAGSAGVAYALRDGQLGAPPQIYGGTMPWMEGVADVPPIAESGEFRFFTGAERAFIEPAIDRLIPPDSHGPS